MRCCRRSDLSLASFEASLSACFVFLRVDFIKVGKIMDFSCDHRLQGATSRDKQSRHSEICADLMQFMTMKREAVGTLWLWISDVVYNY